MLDQQISRRSFLKVTTVAGTGMLVGCSFQTLPNVSSSSAESRDLGLFIQISKDNKIKIISPTSEMGQGTHTAHAMIIADELEANWEDISVVTTSLIDSEYKTNSSIGVATGGNNGIKLWWQRLAEIGAGTRELLVEAGAREMRVELEKCEAKNGYVLHRSSGQKVSYGQLAESASKLKPSSSPILKSKSHWQYIGKAMPRLDIPSKINGSATYGADVRLPDMVYAAVKLSPFFGGEIKTYDATAALALKGVEAVIPIPHGISVVAKSTWHAQKGIDVLEVEFQGGRTHDFDSPKLDQHFNKSLNKLGKAELPGQNSIDLEYDIQFLSHAALEPMNCTADVTKTSCEIWGPFQAQSKALETIKKLTEFGQDQIKIHTTYVGGGFGGRFRLWADDFIEQAVTLSKNLGKPVQVMWSREEDIKHDYYHPASKSRFQISFDDNGMPSRWENQHATGSQWVQNSSVLKWLDFNPLAYSSTAHAGFLNAVSSVFDPKREPHYDIEGVNFQQTVVGLDIPLGWWRSFMFQNTFFLESAIDESAYFASQDPFEYRMKLLRNKPRFQKVLACAADKANWGSPLPEGHGRGISICNFAGSICAEVAEVSLDKRDKLIVHRVDCAVDVGKYVNPDTLKAQVEGCVVWGISIVKAEEITFENGRVQQSNYDDYKIAKMKDTPLINVEIIKSEGGPYGGDAGLPPTPPAITNAIYAATGKRIRKLPIGKQTLV